MHLTYNKRSAHSNDRQSQSLHSEPKPKIQRREINHSREMLCLFGGDLFPDSVTRKTADHDVLAEFGDL
jgi:hypothetical protein